MHQKEQEVALTDRELNVVEQVARERGITTDEASTQLAQEALAQRFRRHLGRAPATVYPIKRSKP